MPAKHTPNADFAEPFAQPKGDGNFLNDIDAQIDKASTDRSMRSPVVSSGRRKNIDRRESDKKGNDAGKSAKQSSAALDRRQQGRRQKAPVQKTDAEKKQAEDEIKLQQHRKKILLAGCEPVMGFNFDFLAMDDYPENALVAAARRDRDYWLLICAVLGSVFFFGLLGFVSPGVAGVSCGLGFLSAIFAFSPVRKHFFSRPPLHQILAQRKRVEFRALNHIQYLEGKDGLAWRCEKLKKYNSNLAKTIFSGLYHYSKKRQLLNVVRQKKHIRLYLLLMIEAQKAYKRLEKDYLENHFSNLEAGLDDRIEAQEANKIEQMLNNTKQTDTKPKQS